MYTQCSGSGMVHRQDDAIDALGVNGESWDEGSDASRRLAALVCIWEAPGGNAAFPPPPLPPVHPSYFYLFCQASFQRSIVDHAMQFPSVQWISYSTCSVNTVRWKNGMPRTGFLSNLTHDNRRKTRLWWLHCCCSTQSLEYSRRCRLSQGVARPTSLPTVQARIDHALPSSNL